jgi:hypothetical protein
MMTALTATTATMTTTSSSIWARCCCPWLRNEKMLLVSRSSHAAQSNRCNLQTSNYRSKLLDLWTLCIARFC